MLNSFIFPHATARSRGRRRLSFESLEARRLLAFVFDGNQSPVIEDFATYSRTFTTSGLTGHVNDLDLSVGITHPRPSDLEIALTGPNGIRVVLFSDYSGGGNDIDIMFDDDASAEFDAHIAPFQGRFQPKTSLATFGGLDVNGEWTLDVIDKVAGETGTVNFWGLWFDEPAPELNFANVELVTVGNQSLTAPLPGDSFGIRITWEAKGMERAFSGDYHIRAEIDGIAVESTPLSVGFGENGVKEVILTGWQATAGQHTAIITLDSKNVVREVNEANNHIELIYEVTDFAPLSGQFAVANNVRDFVSERAAPNVAISEDGTVLVVWSHTDSSGMSAILAQRFDQQGKPTGDLLNIKNSPFGAYWPAMAAQENGNFVVAWIIGSEVHFRRFDSTGHPLGEEVNVNDTPLNSFNIWRPNWHIAPSVVDLGIAENGDVVVVWTAEATSFQPPARDDWGSGVYARLYDAVGVPKGDAFLVNERTEGEQRDATVAMLADGRFAIAWESAPSTTSFNSEVRLRIYSDSGQPQTGELVVDSRGENPRVAMQPNGDAIVVWDSDLGLFDYRSRVERFSDTGKSLGPDRFAHAVDLAAHRSGAFLTVGNRTGQIQGELFDAGGQFLSRSFPIGSITTSEQHFSTPRVAINGSGNAVVVWQEWRFNERGDIDESYDLVARQFHWELEPKADLAASRITANENQGLQWGGIVSLEFAAQNLDITTNAPATNVAFYLSADQYITESDILLSNASGSRFEIPPLAAGEIMTSPIMAADLQMPLAPPEGFPNTGIVYIGALLDPDHLVDEFDELNNSNVGLGVDYLPFNVGRYISILTHGFNADVTVWQSEYKNRVEQLATGTPLEGLVETYSAAWDSTSGWANAASSTVAAIVFARMGNPAAAVAANLIAKLSMELAHRQAEAAAREIVTDLLSDERLLGGDDRLLTSLHLIGHSRGAAVNARVSQLLTEKGFIVDQFTALDGFSTDWPDPANILGDIAIEGVAAGQRLVNHQVEQPLTLNTFGLPQVEVIDAYLASLDLRAPSRPSFHENATILGTAQCQPSHHLNVHAIYFALPDCGGSDVYLRNSPLGRAIDGLTVLDPMGAAESLSVAPPPGRIIRLRDVSDGSFEQLGEVLEFGERFHDDDSIEDPLILNWIETVSDSRLLLSTAWNVEGDVRLVSDASRTNTVARLSETADTSLGQFIELAPRAAVLQFNLTIRAAGAGDELRILFDEEELASIPLAQSETTETYTTAIQSHAGKSGQLTFRLTGASNEVAVVDLDEVRIVTELAIDELLATPSVAGPAEKILLEARNVGDPYASVSNVSFYRESNGVFGLQIGVDGDELIGVDVDSRDGWSTHLDTFGLATVEHDVYAVALGESSETGEIAVSQLTITSGIRPWQNPTNPYDVNGDSLTSPIDALIIINSLNTEGSRALGPIATGRSYWYDTNGDDFISPVDVLLVINKLNSNANAESEFSLAIQHAAKAVALHYDEQRQNVARRPKSQDIGPASSASKVSQEDSSFVFSPQPTVRKNGKDQRDFWRDEEWLLSGALATEIERVAELVAYSKVTT